MDFRQLRYFAEAANARGINDAAARLRVSQSSVSRRIQDLERELGVTLFERHVHGTELTEAGRNLLARAMTILQEAELAKIEVRGSGSPAGPVAIGSSPAMSHLLLADLTHRISQSFPQIRLQFVEGAQYALMQGLDIGTIDMAVMVSPRPIRNCVIEPLISEPLYWVFRSKSGPRSRGVSMRRLAGRPMVLFPRPSTNRDLLDRAAESVGTKLDVRWEIADLATQIDFIRRGLADGILPMSAVHLEVSHRSLTAIPIDGVTLTRSLVLRSARGQSSAPMTVASAIRVIFKEMIDRRAFGGSIFPASSEEPA